jgi:hypothetical protein
VKVPPFGWIIPLGFTFDNLTTCASCRAEIAWTITKKGNRAPLNRDGISHFATCPAAADHRRKPTPPPPARPPRFDGATYVPVREAEPDSDRERLARQLDAVKAVLLDHEWHRLSELARRCGGSEAAVSARIRDLRKSRFGEYTITRRYVSRGLHEYRLEPVEGTR